MYKKDWLLSQAAGSSFLSGCPRAQSCMVVVYNFGGVTKL